MSLIAVISTAGAAYVKRAKLDALTLFLLVAKRQWISCVLETVRFPDFRGQLCAFGSFPKAS